MKSVFPRVVSLLFLMIMFTACLGPDTPQETAEAFWEAVAGDDARGAVRYSTLEEKSELDAFGQKWEGYEPEWKKVVIEGEKARIHAEFRSSERADEAPREVVTYLVKQNGEWKVDYARTAEGLSGGVFAALLGELGKLGEELTRHFSDSSEEITAQMETMRKKMDALSEEINAKAAQSIERYGEALRKSIDELAESAREALKEKDDELSEEDKEVLDDVADDLEEQSDDLDDPNADTIASSSAHAAKAQAKLLTIDDKALEEYKEQWRAWQEEFEVDAQQFIDELNAELKRCAKEKK